MVNKRRSSRFNYSIKRKMQIRIFLKVLSISTIGIGLMAVIFYAYSNREINESYRQFHIHARNFLDYLLPAVILSLLAAVCGSAAVTIFFPHKIAGPLYRIEREMKEKISEGDLSVRFKLRKNDELGDLAEAVNLLLDKLGSKIQKVKQPAAELDALVRGSQGKEDSTVKSLVEELNKALNDFKT